jgi:hypothetical protein
VCATNDRSLGCFHQNNRDAAERSQYEADEFYETSRRTQEKQRAQTRDDQRKACLKKLGPYDSASLCPR